MAKYSIWVLEYSRVEQLPVSAVVYGAHTVLGECGLTPDEITHVILTHGHFDHMGGTDLFPKATFFIQERELSRWVWAMSIGRKFRWLMEAVDPGDILRVVEL